MVRIVKRVPRDIGIDDLIQIQFHPADIIPSDGRIGKSGTEGIPSPVRDRCRIGIVVQVIIGDLCIMRLCAATNKKSAFGTLENDILIKQEIVGVLRTVRLDIVIKRSPDDIAVRRSL